MDDSFQFNAIIEKKNQCCYEITILKGFIAKSITLREKMQTNVNFTPG